MISCSTFFLVDPYTGDTTLLKKVYKITNGVDDKKLVGKNKVLVTFVSNNALNGTGFKAEVKLSTFKTVYIYVYLHALT